MLIEIVVAVGIIALVLVGVSDLLTRSSRTVTFQKDKDAAISYAQKMLNDYRVSRDEDPLGFFDTVTGLAEEDCAIGSPYKCSAVVSVAADYSSAQITATVKWDVVVSPNGETQFLSVSLSETLVKPTK